MRFSARSTQVEAIQSGKDAQHRAAIWCCASMPLLGPHRLWFPRHCFIVSREGTTRFLIANLDPSFPNRKFMRMKSRLDALERSTGTSDISDYRLLVQLLGKRDARFWPSRHNGQSRLGILQRCREYLAGVRGISSKADGKSDWKNAFEARNRLIQAGYVDAVRGNGEVTSLIVSPLGEMVARRLVGSRLFTLHDAIIAYVQISDDSWTSESVLFGENLLGCPSDWDHKTEIVLPLLTAGLVKSNSDSYGRIGYRKTPRELPPDAPSVDVAVDESMDSIYVRAFNAERSALMACEPIDASEVWIPLPPTALAVYKPSEESPSVVNPQICGLSAQDLAMPQTIFDDLYGAENGN